jgi:DNA-directed RNA polymerase II subunit RPB2
MSSAEELKQDIMDQNIIDCLFRDNQYLFTAHHLDSYNEFFKTGITNIIREKNPIKIMKNKNEQTKRYSERCNLYIGGKEGNKLYFGKPIIVDNNNNQHYMYPNEARLRNMTYGITIHYDVDVEFFIEPQSQEEAKDGGVAAMDEGVVSGIDDTNPTHIVTLKNIYLGRFPIMLMSDLCILKGLSRQMIFELGECKNEHGGYFIIDGKEKCIISQEKFADNMLYIKEIANDVYSHSADIRSVSEDASKPIRTLSVRIVAPTSTKTNNHIVVNVPNVRKPVPLFILMRALGLESDKEIIEHCLLDIHKNESYIDLFIPSIHDAGVIFTQYLALEYIASLTKGKTVTHANEIITNYLLPHVGEMNFNEKAFYLGYMVKELLRVYTKETKPTDRDNFRFKRVETTGSLMYDLFKEYYTLQQRNIRLKIDKEYYYKQAVYENNFTNLISANYSEFFSERIVESGFKKAFKGNWGAETHTKRIGVIQDLNRLSYNSAFSHLRKINLPLEASAKVVGPRLLHSSQFGIIDPLDTPDGGNIGTHKNMAMSAYISNGYSYELMLTWLKTNMNLISLLELSPRSISKLTRVLLNGRWVGVISNPSVVEKEMKNQRRNGLIPVYTSISWNIKDNTLFIYTDSGRLCRPLYFVNHGKHREKIEEVLKSGSYTWSDLVSGFNKKEGASSTFSLDGNKFYKMNELYDTSGDGKDNEADNRGILEYLDTSESECCLIASTREKFLDRTKRYSHLEIHPSLMLGVMGNQIVFPENNQLPRDLFACGQMKQAVSLYHSNYQTRIDKMGVVLNNGQIPLVKSRYLEKMNREEHPYGENVIAAIMCYGGYNVEDSILFNEASIKRGLFRTTYYSMYESYEESSNSVEATDSFDSSSSTKIDSRFTNIENDDTVTRLKTGYDYSHLNKDGIIKENTPLNDKTVLIGRVTKIPNEPSSSDSSIFPKKGQSGYVDKSFITEGSNGNRLAKVRVRDERLPSIGDKFCSRCGQKGTLGLVIPEEDMPFTAEGIRPDIIINPHAIPSRMTIGQLVETVMSKACSIFGGFGDCSAFTNKGSKHMVFGDMLSSMGYHSSGNELLYNGQSGEQMYSEIFIGPTYYMRLKHMVKDKINYRPRGPRTFLTRQPVQGRANDGGLRIGEMERDGVIGHGASFFLRESLMERGDKYEVAVCNKTGMIAIFNTDRNIFLSPYSDGPIRYSGTINSESVNVKMVTKYGRSFSILHVPYAFKLLIHELQTMNVQMRIITEDNIDQISSMSFSDNIVKLLGKDATVSQIVKDSESILVEQGQTIKKKAKKSYMEIGEEKQMEVPGAEVPNAAPNAEMKESKEASTSSAAEQSATVSVPSAASSNENDRDSKNKKILKDIHNLGWYYKKKTDDGDKIFASIILDENGQETELWSFASNMNKYPDRFPLGWKQEQVPYLNGKPIDAEVLVRRLRETRTANNWDNVIGLLGMKNGYNYNPTTPSTDNSVKGKNSIIRLATQNMGANVMGDNGMGVGANVMGSANGSETEPLQTSILTNIEGDKNENNNKNVDEEKTERKIITI